jgi:hypothetical protein
MFQLFYVQSSKLEKIIHISDLWDPSRKAISFLAANICNELLGSCHFHLEPYHYLNEHPYLLQFYRNELR